jgi:hypothetical protein
MAEIITADITAHNGTSTLTLYFATQAYVTKATDTPASTFYDGRIKQPGNIQRTTFKNRATFGMSEVGYGELVLVNADGALDSLLTYGFAGFPITIKRGVMTPRAAAPTWTTVLTGIMDSVDFSWGEVSIKVRDRQQELTNPHQANRYGGTNALPAGLDGVATDLKGKPKPVLYGKVRGIAPPCVNTTRLIYQVSDGVINSVDGVYDRGVALTAGAAYTSQADMETNAPAANGYRVWLNAAGSYVRVGSTPTGTITVDATQGANVAARTPAQLMSQALQKAGVASGDITAADITALDTAAGYECGYWVGYSADGSTITVLDALANSVGAFWGVDRLGKFRMGQVVAPSSGSSVGTITATDIVAIDRVRSGDQGEGVPAWQCKLAYQRIYTPQDDLAAAVPATYKNERAEEYRTVVSSDASIKTQWPKAVELEFTTQLASATDAANEVARRLTLYKARRDTIWVRARLEDALVSVVDLGRVITLQVSRFGFSSGKPMLITGIRTDLRNNVFELTLWG